MSSLSDPMVWLLISLALLAACIYLPIRIQNDNLRNFVMKWILVPVSLVIIVYVYPVGIEIFKKIAVNW